MSASKMPQTKMNLGPRRTGKRPVSAKHNTVPASISVSDLDIQREADSRDDLSSVLVVGQQRFCFAVCPCRTPWSIEMMREKHMDQNHVELRHVQALPLLFGVTLLLAAWLALNATAVA